MQTRRDQLQAYRFVTRRVMAALLHGEPDTPESPMRKLAVATFSGVMVAVLAVAAFGVWGLLRPGNAQSLESSGTLIIDKETGSRYVFLGNDHKLYPVVNYTSARLILNSATITQRQVSQKSIAKYERGATLGIPGAPDALPDNDALIKKPWSVCSRVEHTASGLPRTIVSLLGGKDVGGRELGDGAVVVQAANSFWVIWHNQRLAATKTAISVFPIQSEPLVGPSWLNALPAGPDFKAPTVPGVGTQASFRLDESKPLLIGGVFYADVVGGERKYYVSLKDGLAPIWETEATLLLAEPQTRKAYGNQDPRLLQVDQATATSHVSSTSVSNSDLPHNLPHITALPDDEETPLCASYPDPRSDLTQMRVTYDSDVPKASSENSDSIPLGSVTNPSAVDQVVLPPGGGALVASVPGVDQADQVQAYYLLTDQGLKFLLRSSDLVGTLGYQASEAVPLPPNLLSLIPNGPTLDADEARKPVVVIPKSSSTAPVPQDGSTSSSAPLFPN